MVISNWIEFWIWCNMYKLPIQTFLSRNWKRIRWDLLRSLKILTKSALFAWRLITSYFVVALQQLSIKIISFWYIQTRLELVQQEKMNPWETSTKLQVCCDQHNISTRYADICCLRQKYSNNGFLKSQWTSLSGSTWLNSIVQNPCAHSHVCCANHENHCAM